MISVSPITDAGELRGAPSVGDDANRVRSEKDNKTQDQRGHATSSVTL